MKILNFHARWILAVGLSVLLISGCKDDEGNNPAPNNPNLEVNQWIYENMDLYYLWTDQLKTNPNYSLTPENFFEDLLVPQDRFSAIFPSYDELINGLGGVTLESGYEFALFQEFRDGIDPNNVIALILYIKPNSPASDAGLMRGDIITHINGTTITFDNYIQKLGEISSDHSVTFDRFNDESSDYENFGTVNLDAVQLAENPNHIANVLEIDGKKVAYFMYNFFASGAGSSNEYDTEMDQIFADFKAQGVTELIVDLRYNSGGATTSAVNLASLIAPGVTEENIFYQNTWNDELQAYLEGEPDLENLLRRFFTEKAENLGDQLTAQNVFILVGSRTASASELIINGLMPYMNVTIIGDETIGKNVGSIPIEDTQNPENERGLLPIVFQIFNSDGQSDYANGFIPTGDNFIEEFRQLPLEPLGDVTDPLVARALELMGITVPGSIGGRLIPEVPVSVQGPALKYSIDDKIYSNRTIMMPEDGVLEGFNLSSWPEL